MDCAMTDKFKYEKKALKISLVKRTWKKTLKDERTLARDWPIKTVGVLVGVGGPRAMKVERRLTLNHRETEASGELEPHISCCRHECGGRISSRGCAFYRLAWFQVRGLNL
jgi:hypothetical protein